jgi:hypothetical protein
MSRKRLKDVSSTGGKNANKRGLKHQWNAGTASKAGKASAAKRLIKRVQEARQRLYKLGYEFVDLDALKLTAEEYITYGGPKATEADRQPLTDKITALYKLREELENG